MTMTAMHLRSANLKTGIDLRKSALSTTASCTLSVVGRSDRFLSSSRDSVREYRYLARTDRPWSTCGQHHGPWEEHVRSAPRAKMCQLQGQRGASFKGEEVPASRAKKCQLQGRRCASFKGKEVPASRAKMCQLRGQRSASFKGKEVPASRASGGFGGVRREVCALVVLDDSHAKEHGHLLVPHVLLHLVEVLSPRRGGAVDV
eukprot:5109064-Prymnesium_polylepis.1